MRTLVAAGILAAGGALFTTAVALANAEGMQVEGSYATMTACQADGPHVRSTHHDGAYAQWSCQQGADGHWYLHLSDSAQ
ncbi:hypothetical protein A5634_05270 [Mycobacterium asiaticum]|uniref:Uncharacterized protein n=1 Tax=Mycobacterium asiaticum TaxID=1790 RepID=A0A1A3NND1_MYCAS|nr:hypothetical protein [Mycobacterium asiaticum]OBK23648.1 hypothetical protein A5634_05270 [Mycobacterium asiaticum]